MYAANAQLLAKLVERHARFVIVGGFAVQFYLPERQPDDLDLLIDPVVTNTNLVVDAVNSGALQNYSFEPAALAKRNIQWPVKNYYYVDILTPDEATEFECVWATSVETEVAYQPSPIRVRVAGISTLIAMLSSSEDEKHKRDIELLGKLDDVHKQKV